MIWEIIWSIVLGVFIGSIVSALAFFIIERLKSINITKRWLLNLFLEIDENKYKKLQEIKEIYDELISTNNLSEIGFIYDYKCNFDIYYSIINRSVNFDNKILFKYARFINLEKTAFKSKKEYFSEYLSLPPKGNKPIEKLKRKKIRCLVRHFTLPKMIRQYELQLIRIHTLYEIVAKRLIDLKILKKSELRDSSKELKSLIMSYIGDKEDRVI